MLVFAIAFPLFGTPTSKVLRSLSHPLTSRSQGLQSFFRDHENFSVRQMQTVGGKIDPKYLHRKKLPEIILPNKVNEVMRSDPHTLLFDYEGAS